MGSICTAAFNSLQPTTLLISPSSSLHRTTHNLPTLLPLTPYSYWLAVLRIHESKPVILSLWRINIGNVKWWTWKWKGLYNNEEWLVRSRLWRQHEVNIEYDNTSHPECWVQRVYAVLYEHRFCLPSWPWIHQTKHVFSSISRIRRYFISTASNIHLRPIKGDDHHWTYDFPNNILFPFQCFLAEYFPSWHVENSHNPY